MSPEIHLHKVSGLLSGNFEAVLSPLDVEIIENLLYQFTDDIPDGYTEEEHERFFKLHNIFDRASQVKSPLSDWVAK